MKGGLEQHQSPIQPIAKPSSEAARWLVASGCCKHEQLSANGEEELFALKKTSDGEEDSKLQPSVEGTSDGDGEHDRIPDNHADPSMVRAWTPHVMNEGNHSGCVT